MNLVVYGVALGALLAVGAAAWLVSLRTRDVSFVDSLWSLFFVVAAAVFAAFAQPLGARAMLVLALVAAWALRLGVHITLRNWGAPEDHRYQAIRAKNEPFWIKSLYVVFGLQALLAGLVALPLMPAILQRVELGWIDVVATLLWVTGFYFEAVGDLQLTRFKRDPGSAGKVLDTGLWRYTRHPNYFGDFCVWWAFYLFAVAAGGWWSVASPLVMSALLLKVSGVALLEATITQRRPEYAEYVRRTPAFFPGPPKG